MEDLKKHWLPVLVIVLGVAFLLSRSATGLSFDPVNVIADRVIQKLNGNYSPYGPNVQSVPASPAAPTPVAPQPNTNKPGAWNVFSDER